MRLARTVACAATLAAIAPATAGANTYVVDATRDAPDAAVGDGICKATGGGCTLRAALQEYSAAPMSYDDVTVPAGTYTLTRPADSTTTASEGATGDLDASGPGRIQGAGAGRTIVDAAGEDRVLQISGGSSLTLDGFTLRGGRTAGDGGGLLVGPTGYITLSNLHVTQNEAAGDGGGIAGKATTDLGGVSRSLIDHNKAKRGGGLFAEEGAALNLSSSTVAANEATAEGGGVFYRLTQYVPAYVSNVTISGNEAGTVGGGVWAESPGTDKAVRFLEISFATITGNQAPVAGGAHLVGMVSLSESIAGPNEGADCDADAEAVLRDLLDTDGTCGDALTADPKLGPLADNGGPTPTHALIAGSPAIDALPSCTGTDQRFVARPVGSGCDLGAFEGAVPAPDDGGAGGGGNGGGGNGGGGNGRVDGGPPVVVTAPNAQLPASASERARVRLRVLRRVRAGVARVEVRCAGARGQTCRGRVALRTRRGATLSTRARRFRLAPGEAVVVSLRLNATARRMLSTGRAVKVLAVARP